MFKANIAGNLFIASTTRKKHLSLHWQWSHYYIQAQNLIPESHLEHLFPGITHAGQEICFRKFRKQILIKGACFKSYKSWSQMKQEGNLEFGKTESPKQNWNECRDCWWVLGTWREKPLSRNWTHEGDEASVVSTTQRKGAFWVLPYPLLPNSHQSFLYSKLIGSQLPVNPGKPSFQESVL